MAPLPLPARTAALLRSGGGARAPQMRGGFGAASGLRPRRGAGAARAGTAAAPRSRFGNYGGRPCSRRVVLTRSVAGAPSLGAQAGQRAGGAPWGVFWGLGGGCGGAPPALSAMPCAPSCRFPRSFPRSALRSFPRPIPSVTAPLPLRFGAPCTPQPPRPA